MSQPQPHSGPPTPEYQRRLDEASTALKSLSGRDSWLSTLRWLAFLATFVLLGLGAEKYVPAWLVIPAFLTFIVAVWFHGRCRQHRELSERRVGLYEQGLKRLNDDWIGQRASGERFGDPSHVYSDDLDLFGEGSLFQLICCARTSVGEDRLAAWLKHSSEKKAVVARQQAVAELRDNVLLREALGVLDSKVSKSFNQEQLREWAGTPGEPVPAAARVMAVVLAVFAVLAIIAWTLGLGLGPLGLVLLIEIPFLFAFQKRIFGVIRGMDEADKGLTLLSQVLDLIEQRNFNCEFLKNIQRRLEVEGKPPSQTISHLASRIGYLNNSLRNQFFAPIAIVLCLPVHLAHSITTWRSVVGQHIDTWLDAVGDFEAILSFAGYAYEHPSYPFPNISDDPTVLNCEDIGHPLLPADRCIKNSVTLGSDKQLMLISGSNMSGKSTLLRTLGTNTVLALAGAPVNATSMEVSRLQLGTAMRVSDSLMDGKSLFFAVLGRLKSVVDLGLDELPLLFLLDEILQGTNSHDRRIGAEAVIRSLVERGSIGIVTTHDLALTEIGSSIPGTENVHFADSLKDGEMSFDYTLRPGVVKKSNAIELMRLVGLDV